VSTVLFGILRPTHYDILERNLNNLNLIYVCVNNDDDFWNFICTCRSKLDFSVYRYIMVLNSIDVTRIISMDLVH
jgi:hypothetical protein